MIMEFEKLQEIIQEVLNCDKDEITMDSKFIDDLGADSLDVYQIIMGIEEEFDIEIPAEVAEHIESVGDAVEQIKNVINQSVYAVLPVYSILLAQEDCRLPKDVVLW